MDHAHRNLFAALALLVAPLAAGCMPDTPQTELSWDANDHPATHTHYARDEDAYPRQDQAYQPREYAPPARVATRAPRTYIYQDDGQPLPTPDNYVVKNLPPYHAPGTPAPHVASRSHTRYAAYQPRTYSPAPSAPMAFAWPASGAVISSFGSTASGERNVGINIAAGMGTPIRAAASGTVTYAGDELKSYGNLVLLRHEGGWTTAYAHAERMVVHRGDVVSRGQVIAYVGKSGDVASPQLHFEIRDGTMPVDPRKYLGPRPGHDGEHSHAREGWRDDVVSRADDDDDGDQPSF